MNFAEALRQRQIVLEHRRQAREWWPAGELVDIDDEFTKLDGIVNSLWLERTVNGGVTA